MCFITFILIIFHYFSIKYIEETFFCPSLLPPAICLVHVSVPLGFVFGPFLFAFLPRKLYSCLRPLLGTSFLGHFITSPTYQWWENMVVYSNINKFPCLCLNLSLYSWFHTISCPEWGLIPCQNSFDLWGSTELYCVVRMWGPSQTGFKSRLYDLKLSNLGQHI